MKFFILICLFLSSACLANSTDNLIILTTFSKASIEPVVKQFQQQYPEASIKVLHRRGEAGIRLLEKNNHDIDIVISSSRLVFAPVIEKNALLPLGEIQETPAARQQTQRHNLPHNITVFGCSGYGLMWNEHYLAKHRLDTPSSLQSLAQPQYFHHIIMSSPSRSGTTHLMVESLLQRYGWDQGWELLLQIGGNLASISARSFGVNDAISRGLAGIGPVIDSFAYASQQQFPFIGFSYQEFSPILPSYIAAIQNSNQAKHSLAFIEFMLSGQTQRKLLAGSMHKHSLKQSKHLPISVQSIDHGLIEQRRTLVMQLFDQIINQQLVTLNQAWQLLHEIEKLDSLTAHQRQQYQQALKLASTSPVSAEHANDSNYLQKLSMSQSDVFTARQLNHWRETMADQLAQSIYIAEQILAETQEAR